MTVKFSDSYYTISPHFYRGGNHETGVRLDRKERRALNDKLKPLRPNRFKTEKAALQALNAAGLSLDDYYIGEAVGISLW